MEQIIETAEFIDLAGFLEWANDLATRTSTPKVVFMQDGHTESITCARVVSKRLSDGSEVWDVRLSIL